jgi:hypothetical protein
MVGVPTLGQAIGSGKGLERVMPSLGEDQPRGRRHRAGGARPSTPSMIGVAALVIALFSGATLAWSMESANSKAQSSNTRQRTDAKAGLAATGGASGTASGTGSASASASASVSASASANAAGSGSLANGSVAGGTTTLSVGALTSMKLPLGTTYSYMQPGYNEVPQWKRVDTEAASNGTVQVAWQGADGIHVTPLTSAGARAGSDVVVSGAQEVGGLVALDNGFALLTRLADTNKWGDTAAYLLRYTNGAQTWSAKLTGTASNDTAPVLDGALRWDGTRFGAYFVVHGAGGFADGHYGDKLVYVGASGARLSGGWDWGCSHNEGIALWPVAGADFASLCGDDWRSGIFVSTGISAPDVAPVIERAQCWAGYCGAVLGGLVRSPNGRYAAGYASRGDASAVKNAADSSGRGWSVTSKWNTHQVAVVFMSDASTPSGSPVYLTSDASADHVNVRIAPYGSSDFLVSWETVNNASCSAGTCTGTFTGTHLRVVDASGRFVTADLVVPEHIGGDIAVLPNGSLMWAAASATPSYSSAQSGSGPSVSSLTVAVLKP